MHRSVRPGGVHVPLLLICTLVALLAWALAAAGPAAAAPSEPTLNLTDLQTAITAAGPGGLDGYFKTVLQGATITPVSVKILAVAEGQNPEDGSTMIVFAITDPTVLAEGGNADGMSGSPLFVGDATNPLPADDLVGAVSYGDIFTTGGLGLATPIDHMASIETKYDVAPLSAHFKSPGSLAAPRYEAAGPVLPKTRTAVAAQPVKTSAGTLRRFVLARSRAVARTLHPAAGTAVFVPLSALQIGGLPATSKAFKRLSAQFAKRGVDVIAAGLGGGLGGASDFSTPLVGGASVAAVISRGAFWGAWIGTVTYVNGDVVVAFGHPADYDGPTGLEMANAYIYGIWSSTYDPHKIGALGAVCGTITQDRTYGIAGVTSSTPTEVPVDAQTTVGASAAPIQHTFLPQWVADNPDWGTMIAADACYFSVFQAVDALAYPGNATMDSTVTVADPTAPTTTTYTTEMNNVFDDTYDVTYYAGWDAGDMLSELLSNPNGTAPATATSVSFSATLSPVHRSLELLDFSVRGGLQHGANTVRTFVRSYGEKGTHEQDVTLVVPNSVATTGMVFVYDSWGLGSSSQSSDYSDSPRKGPASLGDSSTPVIPDSESLPDLVAGVASWPLNDALNVTLVADVANPLTVPIGTDGNPTNYITTSLPITAGGATFVEGRLVKSTPDMQLRPQVRVVAARHTVKLLGSIAAQDSEGTTVALYKGSSATPFATVAVHVTPYGLGLFSVKVKLGKSTTSYKAIWGGSASYIGATASCKVRVKH